MMYTCLPVGILVSCLFLDWVGHRIKTERQVYSVLSQLGGIGGQLHFLAKYPLGSVEGISTSIGFCATNLVKRGLYETQGVTCLALLQIYDCLVKASTEQ